jgi:hypothetical protein
VSWGMLEGVVVGILWEIMRGQGCYEEYKFDNWVFHVFSNIFDMIFIGLKIYIVFCLWFLH